MDIEEKIYAIKKAIVECRKCGLYKTRNKAVPGDWRIGARIMFVGIAPGRLGADQTGVPFTQDRTGLFFRTILKESGLPEEWITITNLVRCNPKDSQGRNRLPTREEIEACLPYLLKEIQLLTPRIIVPLGKLPSQYLLGRRISHMSTLHGKVFNRGDALIIPMYHPSYLVNYRGYDKEAYLRDFQKLTHLLKGACTAKPGRGGQSVAST